MAFFGITQLGYQEPIREHVRNPVFTPQHIFRAGIYRDPSKIQLPPLDKPAPLPSIVPVDQLSSYGAGPRGSHVEHTRMRTKHIRNPQGTLDIYRIPLATSHHYGTWKKDAPLPVREPWTFTPRYVHVNSQMTRFVDQMSLTNREFSLF